jgi:dCTP deaminase
MGAEISVDRFRGEQFYPSAEELKYRLESHYAKDEIIAYLNEAGATSEVLFHWPEARRGTLTDIGILRHLVASNIDIHPFDRRLLQTNGYDVRLGEYYYSFEAPKNLEGIFEVGVETFGPARSIYNPFDHQMVIDSWNGPHKAADWGNPPTLPPVYKIHKLNRTLEGVPLEGISEKDRIIAVPPTQMILAHTEEFIGGANVVTTRISGKSTVGRNMIEVCSDANLGDVGFKSRWALEITNKSNESFIVLVVGEPVATVQFEEVEVPIKQYDGRYQQSLSLQEIVDGWEPGMVLPTWRRFGE